MLNLQLARKYGAAIFEIAQEEKKLEVYGKELSSTAKDISSVPELKCFLANPQIQPKAKKELLKKLFKSELSPVMFNFLMLLVDKHRIILLEAIDEVYQELSNKAQGIVIADVTTAYELKQELAERLGKKITSTTGYKVKLRKHLNKDIIGGIIVKIGDTRIDGSITGKLQSLKSELMAKTR